MTCDQCGASLSGVGRWVLPGVRRLCDACKEPPRVVRLFEKPQETWVYNARCQRCGDAFITNGTDVWCAVCDPKPQEARC